MKRWRFWLAALAACPVFAAQGQGLAESCAEIRAADAFAVDGYYIIAPGGKPCLVLCRDMAGTPWASLMFELPLAYAGDPVVNKDSCKRDGWRLFGIFKSQGDCVSFFASDGRNFPDG